MDSKMKTVLTLLIGFVLGASLVGSAVALPLAFSAHRYGTTVLQGGMMGGDPEFGQGGGGAYGAGCAGGGCGPAWGAGTPGTCPKGQQAPQVAPGSGACPDRPTTVVPES